MPEKSISITTKNTKTSVSKMAPSEISITTETEEFSKQQQVAAIFGVTGLVGRELAKELISMSTWKVYGIARKPGRSQIQRKKYHFISCNLLDPLEVQKKLSSLSDITHVFWVTWSPEFPLDSRECCEQNKAMLSNALDAILLGAKSLKHVSLQTGAKHYVSLKSIGTECKMKSICYYDEESPRVGSSGENFYYALEDELKERLTGKVSWSVQRPGLITGCSERTWYNFMGTLCVYGAICRRLRLPLVFGGTRECWEEMYLDISDARLVAEMHIRCSTKETAAEGEAYNAVNGGVFTWKEVWGEIAGSFGVEGVFSPEYEYSAAMEDKGEVWKEIVVEEGLVATEMKSLANWAFMDVLFRYPAKLLCSREKADRHGFGRYSAKESILYWIDLMREEKLIP